MLSSQHMTDPPDPHSTASSVCLVVLSHLSVNIYSQVTASGRLQVECHQNSRPKSMCRHNEKWWKPQCNGYQLQAIKQAAKPLLRQQMDSHWSVTVCYVSTQGRRQPVQHSAARGAWHSLVKKQISWLRHQVQHWPISMATLVSYLPSINQPHTQELHWLACNQTGIFVSRQFQTNLHLPLFPMFFC